MKHHAEFALLVFCTLAAACPIFQARNTLEIVCSLIGTHISNMYWFTLICQLQGHFSRWLFKNPAERHQFPETSAFAIRTLWFWLTGLEIWPPWLPPANCALQIAAVVCQLWRLHGEFPPSKKELKRRPPHMQHAPIDVHCLCSWYSVPEYTDEIRARPGWDKPLT